MVNQPRSKIVLMETHILEYLIGSHGWSVNTMEMDYQITFSHVKYVIMQVMKGNHKKTEIFVAQETYFLPHKYMNF